MSAPDWFVRAVADPGATGGVEVDGARVSYRVWGGDPGPDDVLLVHGGTAHAGWWAHLAPQLAVGRRVAAIDLSGHGDSDHRAGYGLARWADELVAVIADAGLGPRPVVVGHSLGGLVTLTLARRKDAGLAGVIIVDSPVAASAEHAEATGELSTRPHRVHATVEEAVARFRPVPSQPVLDYVGERVAADSVRAVPGGFSWKFDSGLFRSDVNIPTPLEGLGCPVVLLAAEHGIVPTPLRTAGIDRASGIARIPLPDAGHSAMLDQPLPLLAGIRGVLAGWATAR